MAGRKYEQSEPIEPEQFDHELDAVLARYATVEPRGGIEARIMANLRSEQEDLPNRGWWTWRLASLAALVVISALAWRWSQPSQPVIRNRPVAMLTATAKVAKNQDSHIVSNSGSDAPTKSVRIRNLRLHGSRRAALPKLEQFPSPQPLSEQEKIMAMWVSRFHPQAVLIAKVREEELERDRVEDTRRERGLSDRTQPANLQLTNQ